MELTLRWNAAGPSANETIYREQSVRPHRAGNRAGWEHGGPAQRARYKILIDEGSDRLVGAHFLRPGADEFINIIALAMQCDISVSRLKKGVSSLGPSELFVVTACAPATK